MEAKSEQLLKVEGLTYQPLKSNESEGRVRQKYWNFNTTDDLDGATLADGDNIKLVKLLKGTRIMLGKVWFEAMGANMTADIGLEGADGSGYIDADDSVADDPNFFTTAAIDVSGAGEADFAALQEDNIGYELTKDCYLTVNTVDSVGSNPWAADKDFDGFVWYVLD